MLALVTAAFLALRDQWPGVRRVASEVHPRWALVALASAIVLATAHVGVRAVWMVIQTCLILGSVLFATGLLGEQIAGQRAEVRELRRQLDELKLRNE